MLLTTRLRTAAGSWLVAVALLALLPLVAGTDDAGVPDVPAAASASWWLGLLVLSLQAVALVWPEPRARLVAVGLGAPLGAAVGLQAGVGVTTVAVLVAAYLAVVAVPARRAWPAVAAAAALVALGQLLVELDLGTDLGPAVAGSLVQGVGSVGLAVLLGTVVRSRREAVAAHQQEALAVVREHAARVEVAVARERTAMARELHDIAAHHLSGIAVMTGAIGRQIDSDPEGAKAAVREGRQHSTTMLRDLRRLVTLLREDPADATEAGLVGEESLAGVPGLVEASRRAGADVTLAVHEPGGGVGPLAQLSAYRTVQEALTNAARHAPGAPVAVEVDGRDPSRVVVRVRNGRGTAPGTAGSGFGLVGMRERAELTGARIGAGPTPEGGWLVELTLPTLEP